MHRAMREGGVGLDDDVVLGTLLNGVGRVESDEPADLVDHGLRLARPEEAVECPHSALCGVRRSLLPPVN